MKRFIVLLLCLVGPLLILTNIHAVPNGWLDQVDIQGLASRSPFPGNEINCMFKSHTGYIWIGTRHGLFRFDGYQFKAYKNNISQPHFLTSNDIKGVAEDSQGNLWVGTAEGITYIDIRSGQSRHYHFTDFDNSDRIGLLYFTHQGQLWVGSEGGLYIYDKERDEFVLHCDKMGNSRVPHCSVKAIFEDQKGYIWVGTWDKGLFRYHKTKDEWYEMPIFNDINSAQMVYVDRFGKLWVGTWGKGIYRIDNAYETHKPLNFHNYRSNTPGKILTSDYIQAMQPSSDGRRLWIGTAQGLSICTLTAHDVKIEALDKSHEPYPEFFRYGIGAVSEVDEGNLLLAVNKRGLAYARMGKNSITHITLTDYLQGDDNIRSAMCDKQGQLWLGLDKGGLLRKDLQSGHITSSEDMPLASNLREGGRINSIFQSHSGDIICCTTRGGMLVYPTQGKPYAINTNNADWLRDKCVYSVAQDREGNLLIATWKGLSVRYTNGKGIWIDTDSILQQTHLTHITLSRDGNIWATASNGGIFRIHGNIHNPRSLDIREYSTPLNTDLPINDAVKVLQDQHGRLWVCTLDMGLLLYDEKQDGFLCVNRNYSIPDDVIYSMEEASDGSLWVSTPDKLIRISLDTQGQLHSIKFYAEPSTGREHHVTQRGASAVCPDGTLCFASLTGYLTFHSNQMNHEQKSSRCAVTDIRVFNRSLEALSPTDREEITPQLPPFTQKVVLDQRHNDITLEFSSFNYTNADQCRFAYMLEGYDDDWIYAQPGEHSAYYCNLPSGTYHFRLRAADNGGTWSETDTTLTIQVLSPLLLRWWAILIYILLATAAGCLVWASLRQRTLARQKHRIAKMEQEKLEELNHKKLQFFTNITHDLMTPLTVISATVSELQDEDSTHHTSYQIIQANLQRQMRLLQQILEFRKAETGNLRLRVSQGDISEFCRREVESIQPLMQKKKLHLSLVCSPQYIRGYFDSDAIDKILYNLLSNAAKYNREMGFIQVNLTQEEDYVNITVQDNGVGISQARQSSIFTRFYEGEHRKFNTYGTGIGLSLTRDLVTLHHGTIRFESQEGQGTTFYVRIPITAEHYAPEEIEDISLVLSTAEEIVSQPEETIGNQDERPTILVVEDNDEIQATLCKILSRKYRVLTAFNGKEALEALEHTLPELILSDIMMPVMDGVELLRHIRNSADTAAIPVVMLTAKRDDQDRAEAYEVGADAYITKPFNTSVLLARIDNLVERSRRRRQELRQKDLVEMAGITITDDDAEFLKRCISAVQSHISDTEFDQQQFADSVGTSKSTLYKRLKSITGYNTTGFIRSIRMKTAVEILQRTPRIRVAELAYQVGYNDPKYFSTCFKKDYGVLPTDYVAELKTDK